MRKGCIVLFLSFLSILMSQTRTGAVQEINLVATDGFHKTSELTTIQNMNLKHLEIATAPVPHAKLSIDKEVYKPGEKIVLEFIISKGTDPSVWVGILPADVPHGNMAFNQTLRMDYQHFSGRRNGRLTFEAPMTPGAYDFRLNEKDSEIASIFFEVRLPERIASLEQKRIGVSAERDIRIYEKTFHTNRYNANFPYNVHIHDLDGDRISELLVVGVLTDYSFIPTSNKRCDWCNHWQIDSYRWDGQSLRPQKSGRLDVGFDTLVRSAVGRTNGATKVVGVGHLYPCGSARAHAGMAVFNHELHSEHYDWGGRKKKDPCMSDYAMFSTVAMADVDGDGTQEIVAGGSGDPSGGQDPYKDWLLTIRTSDGRSFTEKIYEFIDHGATQERLTDLVVADLDGDGAMEIAAVGYRKINGVYRSILQLFVWDGKTLKTKFTTGFETGKEDFLHRLAVGDLDGDGRPEIILAGWVKKDDRRMWHVQIARWNGTIVEKIAEKSWQFDQDASIESVTVADVDADGVREVVLAGNIHTEGVPDAKKYGYVHYYADWHLKVVSATSPNWEEKYVGEWKSSRQYDTNGNRKPDANDKGALGRLFDMDVGDLDGDGRVEVALAGEWVWTGWHIKVLPLELREPFKWTSTYDFAEAKAKALKDPVVGEVFRRFSGQMTGGKGVVHEKKKITGHTFTLKDAKQAAELVASAKKKAVASGHYIGTIKVNGIRFVVYEGASLAFIGNFGSAVFHMTCDVVDAVVSAVKSAVSSIGSVLPDYDLDPNVMFRYLDEVAEKLKKIMKVLGDAVDGLSNIIQEDFNTLLDLGGNFAGRLKTLTDNLNTVYDSITQRAGAFARSKTDALKGKAGDARDRAGEIAELMMTAAEFAQVLGQQNIKNVHQLIQTVKPELIQNALVKGAFDALKDKMGDEVGLHITVDGVVIELGGTHSMTNRLEDLIGKGPADALFYSSGIRRIDVVVTSKSNEGRFVRFESWSGVTGEVMFKEEQDGSKKMYVQAGFEGGKVSPQFLPVLGLTTRQRITPHDWIKMTAGLDYGSTGLPTLRPMMPGVEVKVELSKDIGANRLLKLTWDPNPKFAYQAQAALAMDCTSYVAVGGGAELSGAINLGLDATQLGMTVQKITEKNLAAVKADLLEKVEKKVTNLVDFGSAIDLAETASATQMDPGLKLQYLNAAAPFMPIAQCASFGNQFSMHKLVLYEANILKDVAPAAIKDLVSKGSSFGLSFGLGLEAGGGVGKAGIGGKLAVDLGAEFGLNLQGQFLSHLADATDDAKKALAEALFRKGHELLSGPTTAVKNYLKEKNLMAGEQEQEKTGMSTKSLSELLSLSMLSQVDWRDEITECIDTYYIQPIKNNPQAMADLAKTDLFFSLGLTPVKGKLAVNFGAELAPSVGVTLHANGETFLNWKGYNTTELQQYTLTVGAVIPVSKIVNVVGKITGAVGWDVFVVELTQKFDSTESVLNPFNSGLPEAGIEVDPSSWVQNIPVGADAKKTFKVTNTGKRRYDVTVVVPRNLTTSVTRANLGENEFFDLDLSADTSQERVLSDSVQFLTGITDTFVEIPINLSVSSTGAASGLVLSERIWKAKILRGSSARKTITVTNRVTNRGTSNVVADISAPGWAEIDRSSLNLKAGASGSFNVSLDTSQDAVRSGQITVKGATNPLLLDLVVTSPKIRMEPAEIRATTSKDQTMKKTLTLYNDGGFDLTVNLKPDTLPTWIKPGKTSLTIASLKHETMNLTLSVKKDCDQYASLVLKSNDPDHSEVTLPITVSAKGDVEIRWGGEVEAQYISLGEDLLGKPDFRGSQMMISSTINSPRRFNIKQFGGEHKRKQTVGFYDSGKLSTLLGVEREKIAKADIAVFFRSQYIKKTRNRTEKVESKCTMTKWVFHDGKNTEEMVQNKWEPAAEVIASGMFTDYDYAVALNIYPDFSQVSTEHKNKLKTRKMTFLLIDVPGVIDLHAPEFSIDLSSLSIFRRGRSYVEEHYEVYIDAIGILRFSKD